MKKNFFLLLYFILIPNLLNSDITKVDLGNLKISTNLSKQFILLSLDNEKGNFIPDSTSREYGLAGAILCELSEMGKIYFRDNKLILKDYSYTGDTIKDKVINLIKKSKRNKSIEYWVREIGLKSDEYIEIILNNLVNNKILEKKKKKILFVFFQNRYTTIDPIPENKAIKKLKSVILKKDFSDSKSLMLISLINICNLEKEIFEGMQNSKFVKKQIEKIAKKNKIGKAVYRTINNIQDEEDSNYYNDFLCEE